MLASNNIDIADNKLAENAGWDKDLLAIEFSYLSSLDLDFDLTITGFEVPEIDIFLESTSEENAIDDFAQNIPEEPISKLGDVWILGNQRRRSKDRFELVSHRDDILRLSILHNLQVHNINNF